MDEKTKTNVINSALERNEIKNELELWYYLSVIVNICESLKNAPSKKETMLMYLLEEVALEAWNLGKNQAERKQCEDHKNDLNNENI